MTLALARLRVLPTPPLSVSSDLLQLTRGSLFDAFDRLGATSFEFLDDAVRFRTRGTVVAGQLGDWLVRDGLDWRIEPYAG